MCWVVFSVLVVVLAVNNVLLLTKLRASRRREESLDRECARLTAGKGEMIVALDRIYRESRRFPRPQTCPEYGTSAALPY